MEIKFKWLEETTTNWPTLRAHLDSDQSVVFVSFRTFDVKVARVYGEGDTRELETFCNEYFDEIIDYFNTYGGDL